MEVHPDRLRCCKPGLAFSLRMSSISQGFGHLRQQGWPLTLLQARKQAPSRSIPTSVKKRHPLRSKCSSWVHTSMAANLQRQERLGHAMRVCRTRFVGRSTIPFEREVSDVGIARVQVPDIGTKGEHGLEEGAGQVMTPGNHQPLHSIAHTHQTVTNEPERESSIMASIKQIGSKHDPNTGLLTGRKNAFPFLPEQKPGSLPRPRRIPYGFSSFPPSRPPSTCMDPDGQSR